MSNIFLSSTKIFRSIPGGDDRSADPAGPPQRLLGPDEHVGDVLVLTEQRDVQQDLQRLADQSEISIVTTNQSQRSILELCSAPSVPQPVVQSRRRPLLGPSPG